MSTKRKGIEITALLDKGIPLDTKQKRDLGSAYHLSLTALMRGYGDEQSWSTVVCSINIAMLLCEQGICAAAMPTIKLAQEAMLRSRARANRTGKWALDGEGIRVIQAALNIHDEQNSCASKWQISTALRELNRRIEEGETA